tara:strand:+ start:222 stop:1292 length:1071 start_codon:yes stop_codon:yes gene_type:complete
MDIYENGYKMKIGQKKISRDSKPFIIAELSANHNQSLKRALELVKKAAISGADAIKLQTYTADTMTFDIDSEEFMIRDESSPWNGRHMHDLYDEAHTPWEWHEEIFNYAASLNLIAFSSPFDDTAVDFLESLNVPAYKIASFECIDTQLIKKVASTGKPMIISTGMADKEEIDDAVQTARKYGCKNLSLLKCTSTYPASPKNTNISSISALRERYDCEVGLSDHTLGIGVACASISFGATIIEKHLTLSRSEEGVDSIFSMEPSEFNLLVSETKKAWESQGEIFFGGTESEKNSRQRRRSLYFSQNIKSGSVLNSSDIKRVRPGNGLKPKHYDEIIGKKINHDVKRGQPIKWDDFE